MKTIKRLSAIVVALAMVLVLALPMTAKADDSKVYLTQTSVVLIPKKSTVLSVYGTDSKVKWTSNNTKVATVNSDGVVRGVKAGTCIVTATVDGKDYTCDVKVNKKFGVSDTGIILKKDNSQTITVYLNSNKSGKKIHYKIDDVSVASCSFANAWNEGSKSINLTIKAKAVGTTYITLTNSYNDETVKLKVTVPGQNTDTYYNALYNYINANGYVNSNGERYISNTFNNVNSVITYNYETSEFNFICYDYSNNRTVTMTVPRAGGNSSTISVVYNYSSYKYCVGTADINFARYTNSTNYDFKFYGRTGLSNAQANQIANGGVATAVYGWNTLLKVKVGYSINQYGFENY